MSIRLICGTNPFQRAYILHSENKIKPNSNSCIMVSASFRKFRNGKDVSGRCFIRVVGKQFFFDSTELNKTDLVLTPS